MKIKGIEFSEETIVNALEKAGISLEKPKKEKPKFEPIQIDYLTVGVEQKKPCYVYVKIRKNDRINDYPAKEGDCGCWFDEIEVRKIVDALHSALTFHKAL